MHRAVALPIGIGPKVLSKLLGDVYSNCVDDCSDTGLVNPFAICPLGNSVRVQQTATANLRLIALNV
jgi:hypothetical protein